MKRYPLHMFTPLRSLSTAVAAFVYVGLFAFASSAAAADLFTDNLLSYRWEQVALGGGGYMLEVHTHPKAPGTLYIERGEPTAHSGRGLYKSTDSGKHWKLVLAKAAHGNSWAGEDYNRGSRKFGPTIAVDANNGDVVFWGTRLDGVWRSLDAGATWKLVLPPPPLPAGEKPGLREPGTRSIVIDPSITFGNGGQRRSATIYVSRAGFTALGTENFGLFKSTDGGDTFTRVDAFHQLPGSPLFISWLRVAADGTLYVTHEKGLARFTPSGGWTDITPPKLPGLANGLGINPQNPREVFFLGKSKPKSDKSPWYQNAVFRSRDGGDSWESLSNDDGGLIATRHTPWCGPIVQLGGCMLTVDASQPRRAYLCDAFSIWRTDDVWATPIKWESLYEGVENIVGLTLVAPPASPDGLAPTLLSGVSDVRGFAHHDVTRYPEKSVELNDAATYVTGYDYCEGNPAVIMAAKHYNAGPGVVLLSTDGGRSWTKGPNPLRTNYGGAKVAVGARWEGCDKLRAVFVPGNNQPARFTADGGATWTDCKVADTGETLKLSNHKNAYAFFLHVAADRVDGDIFYGYEAGTGLFWISRDGGATWTSKPTPYGSSTLADSYSPPDIVAAPGRAGEVWAAISSKGVYRTTDYGDTWQEITFIKSDRRNPAHEMIRPIKVALGAPAPGKSAAEPTVYLFARAVGDDHHSLFRCVDATSTDTAALKWERVARWEITGMGVHLFAADRQNFGRVYLAGANGILYGEPTSPAAPR